jgi:hypothetical protein
MEVVFLSNLLELCLPSRSKLGFLCTLSDLALATPFTLMPSIYACIYLFTLNWKAYVIDLLHRFYLED